MELYEIYWYPKAFGDMEKRSSFCLCNNIREAWKIADKYYKKVDVVEIQRYADIAGGDKGQEYWADLVMLKGKIVTYDEYKRTMA